MEFPEQFYDSLDEDSNYGSLDNDSIPEEPVICPNSDLDKEHNDTVEPNQDLSCKKDNIAQVEAPDTSDDVIPYYEKVINRSEIELIKVNSKCKNGSRNKSKIEIRRRKSNTPLVDSQKLGSKSYLDMFQTKMENECLKKKLSLDASSLTCLNSTPKSFVTCQDFEVNTVFLQSEDFSETESFVEGSHKDVKYDKEGSSTVTSLDSKFYSVSEQFLNNMGDADTSKSKRKTFKSFNRVPAMGGLGPDISRDKLYLLKKRQLYGQQVNQKNRIKMIEKKLLENLQREMKTCSNINI